MDAAAEQNGGGPASTEDDGRNCPDCGRAHRPLAGYSLLTAGFVTSFAGGLALAHRRRGSLRAEIRPQDLVTIGAATHKLSRLIAKSKAASWIRAPFVEDQGPVGHGEVDERARGAGLRLATGQLLVCPHCLGQWIAGAFGVGLVAAPDLTRLVAAIYTAETVSDFLQFAYRAAGEKTP